MALFFKVLEIVAPVFMLGMVGYIWVRAGWEYRLQFVTRLCMTLSVPCLIFVALMKTEIDRTTVGNLALASIIAYSAVIIVLVVVLKLARLEIRTFLAPLAFGNTGNVGLPLALFAFGQTGLQYAVVVFAGMAILSFTFGVWVVSGGRSMLVALKEPMVAATFLGAIFLWFGLKTPDWLTNSLELIGQMAIPLMLITLGVALARLDVTPGMRPILLSVLKIGICVCASYYIGLMMGVPEKALAVLVVQMATPVAVTSYMLAEKYEADAGAVAELVIASTLMSVIYLPVLLGFFL